MGHIVIRHLSGSKENQEDRFPLDRFREITLGRDPSSSIMYSEETEVMVGRQHARITRNPALTSMFFITDLGSRNGTFVNQQRIVGATTLEPGDVVQCGIGGPEFRFEIESEPERLDAHATPRPTADALELPRPPWVKPNPSSAPAPDTSFADRDTLVDEPRFEWSSAAAEGQGRKRALVVGGVLIALIALAAGYVAYRNLRSNELSEAAKSGATPDPNASPDAGAEKYDHVHLSGPAAEAEKDAQRAAWRVEVAPYLTIGSGGPGATSNDFDKPAGVAFSPGGMLFTADDGNRRVQVWDVKTGSRLAELGADVFSGAISGIAISPDNQVLVIDRTRNLAYAFAPSQPGASTSTSKRAGPYDYQHIGARFSEQGFVKLGGVATDSKGRIYVVDALRNDVLRFKPDGAADKTWNFERTKADGDTYLHGCDGIAIDEAGGDLFVASEQDAVVEVFDWETGAYKNRTVGAGKDASSKSSGKRVFFGAVRGLTVAKRRLLAVDESAGHIHVFNLELPEAFNTDLDGYAAPQPVRGGGYQGFFGKAPIYDFEDKTDNELQQKVKSGEIIPGKANPPGNFCSPGPIASHTDRASGETYIAVADQFNYRIVVYRWSDIAKALLAVETPASPTLAENKAPTESKPALAAARPSAPIKKNAAPARGKITSANRAGNVTNAGKIKGGGKVTSGAKDANKAIAVTPSGKNKRTAENSIDAAANGKKAKKVKKEKKVKY
ncbi:MAG TPA: FHA domain-containing protein [Blastocatellia bacterium]|nr:FHA domain-containing protein [Blastocatellia bacterium]